MQTKLWIKEPKACWLARELFIRKKALYLFIAAKVANIVLSVALG